MGKTFWGTFLFLAMVASNVAAEPYEVTANRAVVRKMPTASGPAIAVVLKGEVVDGTSVKGWLLVELCNGDKGYIFGKVLKPAKSEATVMAIEPGFARIAATQQPVAENKKTDAKVAATPLDQGGIQLKAEAADQKLSIIRIRGVEPGVADNVKALAARNVTLEKENERLKKVEEKASNELKALQSALASVDSRLRAVVLDKQRLEQESRTLTKQLAEAEGRLKLVQAGGKGKLLALADAGEAVYFTGVGEAQLASLDGRTAIRFPVSMTRKADRVFMPVKAERYLQGAHVYYILDSSALSF